MNPTTLNVFTLSSLGDCPNGEAHPEALTILQSLYSGDIFGGVPAPGSCVCQTELADSLIPMVVDWAVSVGLPVAGSLATGSPAGLFFEGRGDGLGNEVVEGFTGPWLREKIKKIPKDELPAKVIIFVGSIEEAARIARELDFGPGLAGVDGRTPAPIIEYRQITPFAIYRIIS